MGEILLMRWFLFLCRRSDPPQAENPASRILSWYWLIQRRNRERNMIVLIAIPENNASNPAHQSVKSCVRYLCRASARLQIPSLSFALCWTVLIALFSGIAIGTIEIFWKIFMKNAQKKHWVKIFWHDFPWNVYITRNIVTEKIQRIRFFVL